jgi:hypothetical protein
MFKVSLRFFVLGILLFMAGCGGQSQVTSGSASNPASNVPVGLTVTDDPPQGVTVLFFQLSITAATLTNSSGGTVSLLSSPNPVPVNISQLLTDSAFLGSQNVAAGTYDSLKVTFADPQLTIFNASDTSISSTCAVGTVCEITPSTTSGSSLSLSFSSSPFPVVLSASSPLAFKLDVHLDTVIQPDLSVDLSAANGVTLSEVIPPQPHGPIPALGKLVGTVQGTGTSQFTLQTLEGRSFTINVNTSTTYSGFPTSATCLASAETFSCLATGEVVNVTVTLQTDGTLLATAVDFVQIPSQQTVEGDIIGLSSSGGNTIMDLIIQKQPSATDTAVLPVGRHAKVIVPGSGVTYAVDSGSFVIPSSLGLTFASASNLQVGQTVRVVVQGTVGQSSSNGFGQGNSQFAGPVGPPDVSFTASSITLEPSQIIGTVASLPATGSLSFTLATMPVFMIPPSAAGARPAWVPVVITIDTTSATTFTNFATNSLSGLAVNDVVSIHGWVFSTPSGVTNVTVAADAVVDRPGPTPLF